MKILVFFIAVVLAGALSGTPALAGQGSGPGQDGKMPGSKMTDSTTKDRMQMHEDVLGMMKETMVILRDMNHKPTEAQQKRLDEMITKIDEMTARHRDMMEKKKEKMEDKKERMKK
ncbi:MAG: hypothetical protein QY316_05175 [Thermodesulfobacteriota bacterium]|nr:MAG: hypothetical protein QY316_05175 [Thermodesulfobacteriota bacterium]